MKKFKKPCLSCKHHNKNYCEYWEDTTKNITDMYCTAYEKENEKNRDITSKENKELKYY